MRTGSMGSPKTIPRAGALVGAGCACVLLGAVLACAQSGGSADPDPSVRRDVVVQIADMVLEPQVVEIPAGGNVAWASETEYSAMISFAAGVAGSFTCKQLGPEFSVVDGRLVSVPVSQDMENIALPCPLRPGTYEYEVTLSQKGAGSGYQLGANPLRTLRGRIVVK